MEIYTLKGKVVNEHIIDHGRNKIALLVVDKDVLVDDVIAFGFLKEDFSFEIEFERKEFNQGEFEAEKKPDIYLVFYYVHEDKNSWDWINIYPFAKLDYTKLNFIDNELNLGELYLKELHDTKPTPIDFKIPKTSLIVEDHLSLKEELVEYCKKRIAKDGIKEAEKYEVKFCIAKGDYDYVVRIFPMLESKLKMVNDEILRYFYSIFERVFGNMVSLYNPIKKEIVLNKRRLKYFNLEALKLQIATEYKTIEIFEKRENISKEIKKLEKVFTDFVGRVQNLSPEEIETNKQIVKLIDTVNMTVKDIFYIKKEKTRIYMRLLSQIYTMSTIFPHIRNYLDMAEERKSFDEILDLYTQQIAKKVKYMGNKVY